jgi:hypothetical protein
MPIYQVEAPDGKILKVEAPDGATDEQILGFAAQSYKPEQIKADTGFTGAAKGALENLKADMYAVAGRTGLMDVNEAAQQVKQQKIRASKVFTPTTEGWDESPWLKLKELAGGSIPYMAAPLVAGASATLAPPIALAGGLITGATLAAGAAGIAQFTGSNLSRQMDEGQQLAQTNLMAAGAASIPQAAFDTFGLRMIPGIRKIFGQAGIKLTEKEAQGVAKTGLMSTIGSYAATGAKTASIEGLTEAGQQVFERLQAGLDLTDKEAQKEYFDNFIGGAVLGGALSVPGHAFERMGRTQPSQPTGEEPPLGTAIAPVPNQGTEAPVTMAGVGQIVEPPRTTFAQPVQAPPPVAPVAPTVAAVPPVAPTPPVVQTPPPTPVIPQLPGIDTVQPPSGVTGGGGIEQNRNRSTAASIAQMNKIAANPIYEFVGVDPKMTSGAPIVTGPVDIPANQLGKTSEAIAENGTKVPVQYAVVDAGNVLASHNVDGTTNATYTPDFEGLRSVVGNGRTAGLQASYARGLATGYREKLIEDTTHGVPRDVIEGMQNPMLVRFAQPGAIPKDIGDISNVAGTLSLSTIDQARNDANRVDLTGLMFGDDGRVTRDTIRGFVQSMPTAEQAQLMDANGNTTRQAHDRLNAAIFHLAYGNDDLTHLAHQTDDPESQNIIRAMSESAPQMAQLANQGEYDIRPALVDAAQVAINARRQGFKLSDFIKQRDMAANPLTTNILQLFADNPRSSKTVAESLRTLANKINEEAIAPTQDMFGPRPKRTLQQIIDEHFKPADAAPVVAEKRGYQIDKPKAQIHAEVSQLKNHVDLAKWTVDNAPNRFAKYIAEKVLERVQQFQQMGIPMKVEVQDRSRRPTGRFGRSIYSPAGGGSFTLQLSGLNKQGLVDSSTGTRYSTILHELIHSVTQTQFWVLGPYARKKGLAPAPAFLEMENLLKLIKKQAKKDGITDYDILKGLKNVDELIAHGLTNDKFQDYMAGIKVGPKNGFTKMMEIIRKVLGIDPLYESALDQLMRVSEKTLAPSMQEVAKDTAKMGIQFGTAAPTSRGRPDLGPIVTEEQTKLPAFKRWFGSSKVVDSKGKPMVVYHGTKAFEEYGDQEGEAISQFAGLPNWFAEEPYTASGYAGAEGTMYPVYLSLKKPLKIANFDMNDDAAMAYPLARRLGVDIPSLYLPSDAKAYNVVSSPQFVEAAQKAGYDGIEVKEGDYRTFAAFEPTQIKSAIGNKGTFDPNSPVISDEEANTVERLTKTTPAQTTGQAVRQAATAAWNNVQNNNYRTGLRVAWIDKNSGLTQSLASQPTFDTKGQLRADMLARTQDQMINLVSNGVQTGLPTVNSDGTLGIERSENNLARSQILADKLDGKVKLDGKTLSGRDAVAEVARILRGKDILAEDAQRRARGEQQSALAKELIQLLKMARDPNNLNPETDRPYTIREMQQILQGAKYLRRESAKNRRMNRELQVKQSNIDWAESQLAAHPELQQVLDIWKNVNDSLVTLWEKTGLFTKEQADEYRSRDNYVPLFKSREDLENDPNGYGGTGTKTVKGIQKLKGSYATRNIWENVEKHYAAMVASAYQNQTRKVATGQLKALGLAEIPEKATDPRINLRYRDPTDPFADSKGIIHAIIQNPNDLAAFQMMHYELGPLLKIAAATTRVLRAGALINPMYWIRQLIRDPIHASIVADSGIVTPFHAMREYINILANNSREAEILASRGVIGQVDSTIDIHEFLKQAGTARQDPNVMQKMLHKVMRMHEASDGATRVAIYKNEYAAAKAKGMSEEHAVNYAVHKARESINFAVHGNSPTLNALRNMVPFLSAALTSLDTVYRAATGYGKNEKEKAETQRLFITRAAMMTAMCTAYAMAYQNDDDYKKLPDYVKDNNWLIPNPFGDGHSFIKLSTPFEVGFFFKTIPEAAVRYMSGTSTGKEVLASYAQGLAHNLPGGSIPPISLIPQALKPFIETQANYSFFTGRPIEGMSDQGLPVAARGERASELAKILSSAGLDKINLSPAKIDYLIQGYMAELGTFTTGMASDAILSAQGKTKPARNVEEMPFNKAFMTNPNTSKAVADFYELTHNAQETVTYMNRLKATGQVEEAKAFSSDEQNKKMMAAAPVLRNIGTQMTELRKAMNYYTNKQDMDPEERRIKVNQLAAKYDQVAAQGYKVAASAGINR